jgi:hypothetical protein
MRLGRRSLLGGESDFCVSSHVYFSLYSQSFGVSFLGSVFLGQFSWVSFLGSVFLGQVSGCGVN